MSRLSKAYGIADKMKQAYSACVRLDDENKSTISRLKAEIKVSALKAGTPFLPAVINAVKDARGDPVAIMWILGAAYELIEIESISEQPTRDVTKGE